MPAHITNEGLLNALLPGDNSMCQGLGVARRQLTISNALGLHLRAASRFVKLASSFQSQVWVECGGCRANGKSMLDLTCLAAECGSSIGLEVKGPDAECAISALARLILDRFHELDDGTEIVA
jgi:phosphocarrier protein HPr